MAWPLIKCLFRLDQDFGFPYLKQKSSSAANKKLSFFCQKWSYFDSHKIWAQKQKKSAYSIHRFVPSCRAKYRVSRIKGVVLHLTENAILRERGSKEKKPNTWQDLHQWPLDNKACTQPLISRKNSLWECLGGIEDGAEGGRGGEKFCHKFRKPAKKVIVAAKMITAWTQSDLHQSNQLELKMKSWLDFFYCRRDFLLSISIMAIL